MYNECVIVYLHHWSVLPPNKKCCLRNVNAILIKTVSVKVSERGFKRNFLALSFTFGIVEA